MVESEGGGGDDGGGREWWRVRAEGEMECEGGGEIWGVMEGGCPAQVSRHNDPPSLLFDPPGAT